MLFNSFQFLLVFLPIVLVGYYLLLGRRMGHAALAWLVLASLAFYGYFKLEYLLLLFASYLWNYSLAAPIGRSRSKVLLAIGVTANVSLLLYYKYAHFFAEVAGQAVGVDLMVEQKLLPLAISFFTFQQIAYLVDVYRGVVTPDTSPMRYSLAITFFPHLVAGPIVNYREMRTQLGDPVMPGREEFASRMVLGFSIFLVGLFKKVAIADYFGAHSDAFYAAVDAGETMGAIEAWVGTSAYTFQLYFDFSGYSDMAIGLSYLFGLKLPINFNSPYKATSIVDFWRRWHITLSRFLRDYIYIPLGGNKHGFPAQLRNVFLVMVIGGMWHGAGWTFLAWGVAHGLAICLNHVHLRLSDWRMPDVLAWPLTLLFVHLAWVLFRAPDLAAAGSIFAAMVDFDTLQLPRALAVALQARTGWEFGPSAIFTNSVGFPLLVAAIFAALLAVKVLPNVYQMFGRSDAFLTYHGYDLPAGSEAPPAFRRPGLACGAICGAALAVSLMQMVAGAPSSFLYFNF